MVAHWHDAMHDAMHDDAVHRVRHDAMHRVMHGAMQSHAVMAWGCKELSAREDP